MTPAVSLLDEEVTIEASNLTPGKKVTLETHLINEKERFNFHSTCHYLPQHSSFSTSSDAPLADSCYTGVHGSGPLWSVSRSPGHKPRLWPGDIRSSLQYNIVMRDSETGEVIASTEAVKRFIGMDCNYKDLSLSFLQTKLDI